MVEYGGWVEGCLGVFGVEVVFVDFDFGVG